MDAVANALKAIYYDGTFTIHQAQGIKTAADARSFAKRCADFFAPRLGITPP